MKPLTFQSLQSSLLVLLLVVATLPSTAHALVQQWGQEGDIPIPADYDGDGKADIAVWRPDTGTWWIIQSSTSSVRTQQWGLKGDIPVPADYDGDGKADIAVWRPSTGTWFIIESSTGFMRSRQWGLDGDIPVPADYDGDGKADTAVWRPDTGTWWIIQSSTSSVRAQQWGLKGDTPIPGNYDGWLGADFAVWRPSNGTLYIYGSSSFGTVTTAQTTTGQWSYSSARPVPSSYNCYNSELALWHPSTGMWQFQGLQPTQWGQYGDIPVPARYNSFGHAQLAVFRPANGTWYIVEDNYACIN